MKNKRLTFTKKGEKYVCKYILEPSEEPDSKVFEMCLVGRLSQIIPCRLDEKGNEREFVYEVEDKLSLTEYMKREMNRKQMLILLFNILSSLEQFGTNMVSLSYVAKDTQYIFVNPESEDVFYIVAPVDKEVSDLTEIRDLIKKIVSGVRYAETDTDNYVARIITYINKPGTFSITDTKKFIEALLREINIKPEDITKASEPNGSSAGKVSRVAVMQNNARMNMSQPQPMYGQQMPPQGQPMYGQSMQQQGQPMYGQPMPPQGQPMPPQGQPMYGQPMPPQGQQMPPQGQPMYGQPMPPQGQQMPPQGQPSPLPPMPQGQPMYGQPINNRQPIPNRPPMPPQGQPMAKSEPAPAPQPEPAQESQPSPLPPMPQPSAPIPEPAQEPQQTVKEEEATPLPYLLRVKNNEKIYIDKSEFTIGKSATNVDYTVDDNTAVSRIHCIITRKNGVSYIKDNGSTNGTYLNGKDIKGEENVFLTNNAKLVLGDEEFVYFVK